MSYVSFYRKWRPQTFSEIVGQEYVVKTLQNAISNNRISHSYIFCGPKGTGKTSLARIFAKGLNCEKGSTPDPCNKCSNCLSISAGTNVDVVEIDAASNRGIDDIRDLREKVKYLPVNLRKKVYIIDEAHQITPAAFNAFLKVLEEPPEHVVFIMATTEPHEVLPTIMSRCQRFDFEPIPVDKIKKRLKNIASNENININDDAINLISRYADGSLRDADSILEQISSFGDSGSITVDDVSSVLGIIDQEMLFELANIFLEKNLSQALLFVKRLLSSSFNLKIFTTEFLEHLYILYTIKNYDKPMDILDIVEDEREQYFNQAGLFSSAYLEYLMNIFSDLLKQIKWQESSKTFFKTAIIRAMSFVSIDEKKLGERFKNMDLRLKKMEDRISNRKIVKTVNTNTKKTKEEIKDNVKKESAKKIKSKTEDVSVKKANKKKKVEAESNEVKKDKEWSNYEEMIFKKWDDLLSILREKNISIYAMFIEIIGFKIDENRIYFYLGENKKWHKEHLTKTKNTMMIQQVLNKNTGKNFSIIFEIIDSSKEEKIIKVRNDVKDKDEEDNSSKVKKNALKNYSSGKDNKNEEDILGYLEEKFNIKER